MNVLLMIIALSPFSADRVEIVNDPAEKVVRLIGHVIIEAAPSRITCDVATIYEDRNLAVLGGAVKIVDSASTAEADSAYHYLEEDRSRLKGNVQLKNKDRSIFADSLVYDRRREMAEAYGNVRFVDTLRRLTATGQSGRYDLRRGIGRLSGAPRALMEREGKEPIEVNSREFEYREQASTMLAYDSVRIRIDSMHIVGDTLIYDVNKDQGVISDLVMTEYDNRITGTSGRFQLSDGKLSEFEVHAGQGVYQTKAGSRNEISGNSILFRFREGRAISIDVTGSPKAVLFLRQ